MKKRDKRKMVEIIMGESTYNITYMTAANFSRIPNLLPNKSSYITLYFNNVFMNINENISNKRNMLENLKGCMYNIAHMSADYYSRLPKLVPNES